jgi:hypothetical protein
MIVSRERYLDDTRLHHVSLTLQTRTPDMHSALSEMPDEVMERLGLVLARALDQVQSLLGPALEQRSRQRETSTFGCGT